MDAPNNKPLWLCAGMQSSGSTLVSWCFLQHPRLNGVLDARFDKLPEIPPSLMPVSSEPSAVQPWVKFTIACFRFSEVYDHFTQQGFTVHPLLVVRDCRAVFASLLYKSYGRNGTTADDPPIRTRVTRFLEDFQLFQSRGWPILSYETFSRQPEAELARVCPLIDLPYHPDMAAWPKTQEQIADPAHGNETFLTTRSTGVVSTIRPSKLDVSRLPIDDLKWLNEVTRPLNDAMGYPQDLAPHPAAPAGRAMPTFQNTRRHERYQRTGRVSWLWSRLWKRSSSDQTM